MNINYDELFEKALQTELKKEQMKSEMMSVKMSRTESIRVLPEIILDKFDTEINMNFTCDLVIDNGYKTIIEINYKTSSDIGMNRELDIYLDCFMDVYLNHELIGSESGFGMRELEFIAKERIEFKEVI